jgi:two-component system, NtrC family, response regulator AtoC
MAMRGPGRRARSAVTIDVRTFGWERAVLATLRHSTLAFDRVDAMPLGDVRELGKRDRFSLTGQFAAHQAFLQFAGIADGELDPAEWAVVQKRGADCRLVRVAAKRWTADPVPILTIVQQFAAAVCAPAIDVLRQSSARSEAVYCEIDARLRNDATADLRWFRAAAIGRIASPGADMLRAIIAARSGRFRAPDPDCIDTLCSASDDVLLIGKNASPLERYSGIAALQAIVHDLHQLSETEIAEAIIEAGSHQRLLFALIGSDALDPASGKVIELLQASNAGVWIGGEGIELPDTRWFVVSPRLTTRQELDTHIAGIPRELRAAKLQRFIEAPSFARYLVDGVLPSSQMASPTAVIREPARSYLAALALLGTRISVDVAQRFLLQFSSTADVADLVFDGVTSIDDGAFTFASPDIRLEALQHIPVASRGPLSRTAAEVLETNGDRCGAAMLYAEGGDVSRAIEILESHRWASADESIRILRAFRTDALSPPLTTTLANALIEAGRYRDARELASSDSLLARIERRTGDYDSALARLERMERSFADNILCADLLMLAGRMADADRVFGQCVPRTDNDRVLLGYHRAVLALETGAKPDRSWMEIASASRDYYAARFQMYDCVEAHEPERAIDLARYAMAAARTTAERIDATLDYLFALFTSGRWREARAAALDALLIVDETQGDRAAGGILFVLAFLCADNGQCAHAAHLLDRLRQFYSGMHDERRLRELDLISATIELSRGRFDAALAAAESVLDAKVSGQICEAAALIADDVALITRSGAPLRARGDTANVELTNRYRILFPENRAADGGCPPQDFARALIEWQRDGGELPAASSGCEKLMLMRAALRTQRHAVAESLASEMRITLDQATHSGNAELRALRIAATREFPFAAHDFAPLRWRFATRNRLGQWAEIGSMPALASPELDRVFENCEVDWVACSDHELLYLQGLRNWPAESRDAIAALFRTRSEQYRLRRVMEQEESLTRRGAEAADGIIGMSPAIREIGDLITRIAKRDVSVCILGESGTGKELIARAIHRHSGRRQKAFTTINCAALPENLIESELFGSARGAFTGAERDRPGLIETSDGGTLFLDEIGEMPLAAQAKLLRFLQEREFRRVGETTLRSADVRVVSATNRHLESAVEDGRFREDLYYRVRGIEIVVPPLRDRMSDIPLLASHFLAHEHEKQRCGPSRLSSDAEAAFASHHWPGNVRELQNTIRGAHAIAGDAKVIDLEHLPEALRRMKSPRKNTGSYQDAVVRFRRDLIEKSLAQANGNQNQAAAMLKISRQALAYQIRELGILVTASKRPHV